ncbi:uncharacterized protein LOC132619846 [Lycium barbarum]|uniref:uncharacterized protein LOC132619846 n=1 Tax=Lycium barbarum TaxID=112863 RepID=UPI00293F646F|nr:uncharacterized protein LOC132619846 [Lycium barbarum]
MELQGAILGEVSYGFCLRNSDGNLIYAQAEDIGIATNTEAEVRGVLQAVRYCKNVQMDHIIMQTDSQLIHRVLLEDWKPSWKISQWVEEIQELETGMDIIYTHILREGNKLANALANQALDIGSFHCQTFQ